MAHAIAAHEHHRNTGVSPGRGRHAQEVEAGANGLSEVPRPAGDRAAWLRAAQHRQIVRVAGEAAHRTMEDDGLGLEITRTTRPKALLLPRTEHQHARLIARTLERSDAVL